MSYSYTYDIIYIFEFDYSMQNEIYFYANLILFLVFVILKNNTAISKKFHIRFLITIIYSIFRADGTKNNKSKASSSIM